jgi:hypothetical protein
VRALFRLKLNPGFAIAGGTVARLERVKDEESSEIRYL